MLSINEIKTEYSGAIEGLILFSTMNL